MSNNPWLALSAYQESQSDSFKGRDKDTDNIVTMIQQNEYVVCYAASGDGKSSLINAGVCPKIRKLDLFPIKIEFTSDDYNKDYNIQDFDKVILEKSIKRIDEYKSIILDLEPDLDKEKFKFGFKKTKQFEENCDSSGMLWWKFRTETITNSLGEEFIPVLIFDQFEEVFRAPWKVQFFQWLEKLTKDICPDEIIETVAKHTDILPSKKLFKLLFSMRYEYVGELDYWCSQKNFIPQMMRNRYFLKPLTNEQARIIINEHRNEEDQASVKLAERNNTNTIIKSISNSLHTSISDEVPAFMLSLVCYVLYEQWAMSLAFSIDDLDIGTLIYEYYYQQIAALNMPEEDRNELESVLISSDGKRLRMPIIDQRLQKIDIERYLSGTPNLVSTNLFKVDNPKKPQYIEIIHDKLAEAINEERKQNQKTVEKEIRFKKRKYWGLGCFFILLFSFFGVLSFLSVKPEHGIIDNVLTKTIEKKLLEIELIDNSQLVNIDFGSSDFVHATSLRAKHLRKFWIKKQDSKSYRGICYKNVLHYRYYIEWDDSWCLLTSYAQNAKSIGFYYAIPKRLHFGPNTQKVYLLNSDALSEIEEISCDNSNTTFFIPYRYRNECITNPHHTFDNVYYEELGWFSTMFYRTQFEFWNGEVNIGNYTISNLLCFAFILLFSYYFLCIVWLNKKQSSQISSISVFVYIIIYTILTLLLFIIGFQLYWLKVVTNPIWIPLICIIGIYFLTIIVIYNKVPVKDESRPVAKYCILFNSLETKGWAILIKNALIDNGVNKDDILLDFSILKHGKIDYKSALTCSKSSKHVIALLSKKDLEKSEKNSDFHRVILRKNIHPIIIGLDSFEQLPIPRYLRRILTLREIGTVFAFQSLFISSKDAISSIIHKLKESLAQKNTKALRHFIWLLLGESAAFFCFIMIVLALEDVYSYQNQWIIIIVIILFYIQVFASSFYFTFNISHLFKKSEKR